MHRLSIIVLAFAALFSCKNSSEEIKMSSLNGKWQKNQIQNFDFSVNDAQALKNIIFVVRNNDEYPYSNIRFIVDFTDLSTKKIETDTLNYILAKPNGEWIGRGFGDTKETLFQYKMNYRFKNVGKYRIGIKQAMRKDALVGIEDVGVKIENTKP